MQKHFIFKCLFICLIILVFTISCDLYNNAKTAEMEQGNRASDGGIPRCTSNYSNLRALQDSLASLHYEDERLQERVKNVKSKLESLEDKVETAKDIVNMIIEAKEKADKAEKIIKILTPLPYIGGVAKAAGTALKYIKKALDKAYDPAKKVKKVLEKVEDALESVISKLKKADNALQTLKNMAKDADKLICLVDNCITGSTADKLAAEMKKAVDIAKDALKSANDKLDKAEKYYNDAKKKLDFLTSTFIRQIKDILHFINELLDPLEDLYDSLNIEICVGPICLKIIDALDSTIGAISDIVEAILDPIMDEIFEILDELPIPKIPDLSDLLDLVNLPTLDISISIPNPFDFNKYYEIVKSCLTSYTLKVYGSGMYPGSWGPTGTVVVYPSSVTKIWTASSVGSGGYGASFSYWYVYSGSATIDNKSSPSTYVRNVKADTVIKSVYR